MIQSKRHPLTTQPSRNAASAGYTTRTGILPSCLGLAAIAFRRVNNPSLDDVLILLEHHTLGQGARQNSSNLTLTKQTGTFTRWSEAAGDVPLPWHFSGLPLNLQHYRKDLHWYLRQLEEEFECWLFTG